METELTTISLSDWGQHVFLFMLLWCGMATVTGCVAKLLVPGQRPRGTLATLILGGISTTLATFVLKLIVVYVLHHEKFQPFSVMGLGLSIFLASLLLFLYQLLTGGIVSKSK